MPVRTWPDILLLAVTEIREYGGGSVQVVRRLHALLDELRDLVLPENRAAVDEELRRLDATIAEQFGDSIDMDLARDRDAQGIGGPTRARDGGAACSDGLTREQRRRRPTRDPRDPARQDLSTVLAPPRSAGGGDRLGAARPPGARLRAAGQGGPGGRPVRGDRGGGRLRPARRRPQHERRAGGDGRPADRVGRGADRRRRPGPVPRARRRPRARRGRLADPGRGSSASGSSPASCPARCSSAMSRDRRS